MARPPLGVADRAALRCTAWVFGSLAALSLVSTVAAAVGWWHVAGRESVGGGARTWPAVAVLVIGTALTLAFYGLSRVCHLVTRLCRDATEAASTPTFAVRRRPHSPPRPTPSSVTGSGTARL